LKLSTLLIILSVIALFIFSKRSNGGFSFPGFPSTSKTPVGGGFGICMIGVPSPCNGNVAIIGRR
jgi:hypothetical protein